MELAGGGFDARHSEHVNNTEVLLALLTQNKELEGLFNSQKSKEKIMQFTYQYEPDITMFFDFFKQWFIKFKFHIFTF